MATTNLKTDALKALKTSGLAQNEVYATQDGNIFFDKSLAARHAKQTKQEVEVFVVDEADVEITAEQAKPEKKSDKKEATK